MVRKRKRRKWTKSERIYREFAFKLGKAQKERDKAIEKANKRYMMKSIALNKEVRDKYFKLRLKRLM